MKKTNNRNYEELQGLLNAYYLNIADSPLLAVSNPKIFEPRKSDLNQAETFGLKAIFTQVIRNYEEDMEGEFYSKESLESVYCWSDSTLNIIDNWAIDERYSFSHVWLTDNGIPMAEVYDAEEDDFITVRIG